MRHIEARVAPTGTFRILTLVICLQHRPAFGPRHNAAECQFLDHESRDDLTFVLGLKCRLLRNHAWRSEEHTSELQSHHELVCRLLLEKKKKPTGTFAFCLNMMRSRVCRIAHFSSRSSMPRWLVCIVIFFFNDTATTEIYTLSLHDALPI